MVWSYELLVVDVDMCPSLGCSDKENLLVVGDQMGKGPPSVKTPLRSLETHGIGKSQNSMEKERGFRYSRCAGRAQQCSTGVTWIGAEPRGRSGAD